MIKKILVAVFSLFIFTNYLNARPRVKIDGHLHQYNTRWDKFVGTLETGKIYDYRPNYWKNNLRFIMIEKIDENKYIFHREARQRLTASNGFVPAIEQEQIAQEAYLLVETTQPFMHKATLKQGNYICTGTYSYTSNTNSAKTIFALKEFVPPPNPPRR